MAPNSFPIPPRSRGWKPTRSVTSAMVSEKHSQNVTLRANRGCNSGVQLEKWSCRVQLGGATENEQVQLPSKSRIISVLSATPECNSSATTFLTPPLQHCDSLGIACVLHLAQNSRTQPRIGSRGSFRRPHGAQIGDRLGRPALPSVPRSPLPALRGGVHLDFGRVPAGELAERAQTRFRVGLDALND